MQQQQRGPGGAGSGDISPGNVRALGASRKKTTGGTGGGVARVAIAGRGTHPTPTLTITLEPYRKRQLWPFGGPSYQHACYPRWEQPDIISPDSARGNTITWHHYNSLNTTYVAFVIAVCFKRFTSSFAAWSLASSVSFLQSIDQRRVGIQSLT